MTITLTPKQIATVQAALTHYSNMLENADTGLSNYEARAVFRVWRAIEEQKKAAKDGATQ